MKDLRQNYMWLDHYLKTLEAKRALEGIKHTLVQCSPEAFFAFENARVVADRRVQFVRRWRDLQREFNSPVGPTGHSLDLSSMAEKDAWALLVGKKYINVNGLEPNDL